MHPINSKLAIFAGLSLSLIAVPATLGQVTTFDDGTDGWSVSGRNNVSLTGGNPGANLDVEVNDVFGATIRNDDGLLPDFSGPLTLTVDINVDSIDFFGTPVARDLVVDIRDFSDEGFASVFYNLGLLQAAGQGWQTYAITIDDPTATELPRGWAGAGAEDPDTFEPLLPEGRTFADVLAGADEVVFTTFVPGFLYGFTNFDLQVDNVGFVAIPEPTSLSLLALGGLALRRRRR
ncbi:MAG: PEP-CTERM sorting domain-containing protein [Planctomycetota bacterium]